MICKCEFIRKVRYSPRDISIDRYLNEHIANTCKRVSRKLNALSRVECPLLLAINTKKLYQTLSLVDNSTTLLLI